MGTDQHSAPFIFSGATSPPAGFNTVNAVALAKESLFQDVLNAFRLLQRGDKMWWKNLHADLWDGHHFHELATLFQPLCDELTALCGLASGTINVVDDPVLFRDTSDGNTYKYGVLPAFGDVTAAANLDADFVVFGDDGAKGVRTGAITETDLQDAIDSIAAIEALLGDYAAVDFTDDVQHTGAFYFGGTPGDIGTATVVFDPLDGSKVARFLGDVEISGVLDPTGTQYTPVAANPGDAHTDWVNSTDSNRAYHGSNKYAYLAEVQPIDATLTALAALTIAANSLSIGTGADAFSQTAFAASTFPARASTGDLAAKTITDLALSLLDDTTQGAMQSTLGLVIGTNVQAFDQTLAALAAADWAANAIPIGSGANTLSQVAFAANTFPGRASTGNLVAKAITDAALAVLAGGDVAIADGGTGASTADAAFTNLITGATSRTPVLADQVPFLDDVGGTPIGGKLTFQQLFDLANSLTAKTSLVDADTLILWDSAASNVAKEITFANLKTTLGLTTLVSSYNTLFTGSASHTAARAAGTYALTLSGGIAQVSGTGTVYPQAIFRIVGADYPTINGIAPKLRIRVSFYTNDVAPTGTYTFGLYPVTRPGTSGGSGLNIFTLGTVVVGSNGAAFSTPAADGLLNAVSADFALPADGDYALGFVQTGTVAANSHIHMIAHLQLHNA